MMARTAHRSWRCHGQAVYPGATLTVRGERGARFRFKAYVVPERGRPWVDCYGGRPGHERDRSFDPDRVAVVHGTGPRSAP